MFWFETYRLFNLAEKKADLKFLHKVWTCDCVVELYYILYIWKKKCGNLQKSKSKDASTEKSQFFSYFHIIGFRKYN